MAAQCERCGSTIERHAGFGLETPLIMACTALALLIPANFLVLIQINLEGADRFDWIISSTTALWAQGYFLIGALVGLFVVVMPPLWLSGLIYVLLSLRLGRRRHHLGWLFRWVIHARQWAMADVFLVGSVVAFTRLQAYAVVQVGPGGWAFIAAAFLMLVIDPCISHRAMWRRIGWDGGDADPATHILCRHCNRSLPPEAEGQNCPRCLALVHRRKADSLGRAVPLIIAGYVLYIPAMALPIMTLVRFGYEESNTITSGVRELFALGMWPLAVIVLLASVIIPLVKLSGMTWFLIAVRRRSGRYLITRTRLYHLIEIIGRWSNIDVFMISILSALVQFGGITTVRAEPGATAFALVVLVTMFASNAFDPRLMWDAAVEHTAREPAIATVQPA